MAYVLPLLVKLPAREMAGPTPWCNWVIPGQVIAGAYPASLSDEETDHILTLLLQLGMNTFVCLQAEVNIHVPEHSWRAGHGLRPYIRDAQRLLSRAHAAKDPSITQQKIDFLHLPIIDGSVTTDTAMHRLAEDCCERVMRGEKMYIHCWGGHGRTGTLVAVMLARLYGLNYTLALRHTQAFHDSRVYPQGVRSPQTAVQRAQVRRLLLLASDAAVAAAAHQRASSAAGSRPGTSSSSSGLLAQRVNSTLTSTRKASTGGSSSLAGLGASPVVSPVTPPRVSGLTAGQLLRTVSTPSSSQARSSSSSSSGAIATRSLPSRTSMYGQQSNDGWLSKQATVLSPGQSTRNALQDLQASLVSSGRAGALTSQTGTLTGSTRLSKSRSTTPMRAATPAGTSAAAAAAATAAVERLSAELARLQRRSNSINSGSSSGGGAAGSSSKLAVYSPTGSSLKGQMGFFAPSTPGNDAADVNARIY